MRRRDKRNLVATQERGVKRPVKDVGSKGFLGLDQRLGKMLAVRLTDTDVIAILDKHLGKRERQTIDLVQVALVEQNATALIRNRLTVRKLRRRAEAIQNRLFVVRTGDALLLLEDLIPFIDPLVVDAIKRLVEDRLNDGTEVRTPHWDCHVCLLLQ